jgi:hypothetical protein
VSTKRPKIGYFDPKKRGTKIKKVRQKCHLLMFFNEIFIVYALFDGKYEIIKIKNFGLLGARMGTHDPLGQSVNYWYKSMRCCAKEVYFLKISYMGLSEKRINGCPSKKFF